MALQAPSFKFDAIRVLAGFIDGQRQRGIACPAHVPDPVTHLAALRRCREDLAPYLPAVPLPMVLPDDDELPPKEAFLLELGQLAGLLLTGAGIPVMDAPRVIPDDTEENGHLLILPSFSPRGSGEALTHAAQLFQRHTDAASETDWPIVLDRIFDALETHAPRGDNACVMMMKAAERNIPVARRPCGAYHFGWGKNGKLFRGSVSELTGTLATRVATDKRSTHLMMRAAGIPVAEQYVVKDIETALDRADTLGYPVVLKANHMELGYGVESDLRDAIALRHAWKSLSKHKRTMLIEKHVPGDVYRINVIDGKTKITVLRLSAEVIGDGVHKVTELIEIANQDPQRSNNRFSPYELLKLNDIALDMLARQNLAQDSIPAVGQRVLLGLKTNRKDGGTSHVLGPDAIHPVNLRLAERAAEILRLNIAGVDLLLPDVSVSWRKAGGHVCEVNSAPGLSESSKSVLDCLLDQVPEGGRIPVDIVLDADAELKKTLQSLFSDQTGVALITDGQLEISGDGKFDLSSVFTATYAALLDRRITRMVICTETQMFIKNGMVVDQADRIWASSDLSLVDVHATFPGQVRSIQRIDKVSDFLTKINADPKA